MIQMITMRYPGGLKKAFTLSYDDGVEQDARLISLMEKYGVKGTFNINSGRFAKEGTVYPEGQVHRRMTLAECKKVYSSKNVEVICHGSEHKYLTVVPPQMAFSELLSDKTALEREFGKIIRGLAYPYGPVNDDVISAARLCGFIYGRTTKKSLSLKPQTDDLLNYCPTCHHNTPELFDLANDFTEKTPTWYPFLFYVWGHSYEFEQKNNWDRIEELFKKVGGRQDVWYATNTEIFEYIEAFKRLVYSGDGLTVYNPTLLTIYGETDNESFSVAPGECVKLREKAE
ncbi:MAG: polysaccharide deacetylase family protein [Clostridia bacterium]|nr:polysaccharide deacetylase family protein [Clostridia bacterium]